MSRFRGLWRKVTYLFRAKDGETVERVFHGKPRTPRRVVVRGKTFVLQGIAGAAIHAYTPVGAEADKLERRHYRQNTAIAKGLVDGTMNPPEDRDVVGDKQPRSSVAQFNSTLDHARKMK